MEKNRISEFLKSINSEKWNCVYQVNGMTLLTSKEYNYLYEERVNLETQLKKQKEIIEKAIEYIEKEVSYLMPYEIYKNEVEHIQDGVIKILKNKEV